MKGYVNLNSAKRKKAGEHKLINLESTVDDQILRLSVATEKEKFLGYCSCLAGSHA